MIFKDWYSLVVAGGSGAFFPQPVRQPPGEVNSAKAKK